MLVLREHRSGRAERVPVVAFELGLEGCVGALQVERMRINQARVFESS